MRARRVATWISVRAGFWPSLKRCCLNPKFELFCTNPLNLGRTGKKSY
jgi:hypothetical protein